MVGAGDGAESTATMAGGAKSSSSAAKRAKVEAENRNELLRKLPEELWSKIVDENVQQNDVVALAMTCRFFREKQEDLGKKVETNLDPWRLVELRKSGRWSRTAWIGFGGSATPSRSCRVLSPAGAQGSRERCTRAT